LTTSLIAKNDLLFSEIVSQNMVVSYFTPGIGGIELNRLANEIEGCLLKAYTLFHLLFYQPRFSTN